MNIFNLKRILSGSVLGLLFLLGASEIVNAQDTQEPHRNNRQEDARRRDYERERRERERADSLERFRREQEYYQQDILEQQRVDVERIEQFREEQRIKNQFNRYRVTLEGREFQMNYDGAELLKQALNTGYQQGFQTGKSDHKTKSANDYSSSVIYQNGSYDYQSDTVDLSLYQFYFREGFRRGYEDGFSNQHQFGKSTNGIRFISDTVSQAILKLEQF